MNGKPANHLAAIKTAGGGIAKKFHFHPSYPVFSLALAGPSLYVGGAGNGGHVDGRQLQDQPPRWDVLTDGDVRAITLRQGIVYVGGHFNNYCQGHTGTGTPLLCNHQRRAAQVPGAEPGDGQPDELEPDREQPPGRLRDPQQQDPGHGGRLVHGRPRRDQQGFVRLTP